ncbi:MAG: AmmeMemoRadiSam system radical SAM enzyme [Nitrospinaceae bacterium]
MASSLKKTSFDEFTRPGDLFQDLGSKVLVCTACGHRCKLKPGQRGICKVRYNAGGTLYVPARYAAGVHNDPIEKKPFFHALPGSLALSFGMLGCDFHCAYCQNWFTSQTLRDDAATESFTEISAEELCQLAVQHGAQTVVSTYNEPLITSEWAVEVFRQARRRGLATGFVSNGHGTPEVIEYLRPWVDLYKVDLKCFDAKKYRRLGGNLEEVLDSIRRIHAAGMWVEIVTLVVPDYNDTEEELAAIAEFVASVSKDIPWHVTGFHPDYKMSDRGRTPEETLFRAWELGRAAGLRYVYCGNRAGRVGRLENTVCPECDLVLIEREGFRVLANRMREGACSGCGTAIPGFWTPPSRDS